MNRQHPESMTWTQFRSAVRKVDRNTLLAHCAETSARMWLLEDDHEQLAAFGLNPWNIADLARTALAWGSFQHPPTDYRTFSALCNSNMRRLESQPLRGTPSPEDRSIQLIRLMFHQFPDQKSSFSEVARSVLLFGSALELPPAFVPEAMKDGWFEQASGGLTLDDYVGSLVVISSLATLTGGRFSPELLASTHYQRFGHYAEVTLVNQTFVKHLVISVEEFKRVNRASQGHASSDQMKYAFNPLKSKPFVEGVGAYPLAPSHEAIIRKAAPPAIYHLAVPSLEDAFTRDLGTVFQHYVGRQLGLIRGDTTLVPETRYGNKKCSKDSCDWFLDLPGLLVLIECKSRQPPEPLRVGGNEWLTPIAQSIGKGISQLNESNRSLGEIAATLTRLDPTKRRVGFVVTLEPFYVDQVPTLRDQLPKADFPVAVISSSDLEELVNLSASDLAAVLIEASARQNNGVMSIPRSPKGAAERDNPLLKSAWESISLVQTLRNTAPELGGYLA